MEINIPLTIEKQLEKYATQNGHSERHETLWHAWYQNKHWISQLLQITLSSFPTYSRHDETHALSVLNNIEMILGQERIAQLSATDCFVLLHTVYIHDIGMCITQQDRKQIIENEAFIEMLDQLETDGDETVVQAIKVLKRTDYKSDELGKEERIAYLKQLYRAKLDVYYAIIELMGRYRRSEHGEKSKERLYEWTLQSDKLGAGFSMAGMPLRIFLAIARSAQMHTCDQFEEINKLPRKDGGYASDYYHPRFISVLLMLGDLLDMDNDRFHPMVFGLVEEFSESSKNHYDKHRAIRRLNISPDAIEIEADCKSQNALRLVRRECDMLVDILHEAGYRWTSICPEGFKGSLPSLKEVNLFLRGKQIPEELVKAQFVISQKKAFSILEGSNLYDGRFVFLREFLQNAIDATKMQYWYDYLGTAAYYYNSELVGEKSPGDMNKELAFEKYPIEIGMKIQKRDSQGKVSDVTDEDDKNIIEGHSEKCEYGVLVSVKDFGTGIDKDSIIAISKVGNSRLKDIKAIRRMPNWLRPTAEFGVGLQSAFLLTGSFKCFTRTRSGERYEITFSSGASAQYEGYINVVPTEHFDEKNETYGTRFEIFVPLGKKYLHSESLCTWSGSDPFNEDYDNTRVFRHTAELISQMALYLDGILGEMIFPIKLRVENHNHLNLNLNKNKDNQIKKMNYWLENGKEYRQKRLWIFQENENNFFWGNTENTSFALEYGTARLYIWAKEIDVFCVVSGANLIKQESEQGKGKLPLASNRGVTIFYKGIQLQSRDVDEIEIFEFIDIKGSLVRSHLNISRRGFTAEGEKYFEQSIYKRLLNYVREILQYINQNAKSFDKLSKNIRNKIDNHLLEGSEAKENKKLSDMEYHNRLVRLTDQLLSLTLLAHLAVKDINDEMHKMGKQCSDNEICVWQDIIHDVNERLEDYENRKLKEELGKYSVLFRIQGYMCYNICKEQTYTILDLFSNTNHFGILQRRASPFDTWSIYIISIEQQLYELFDDRMVSGITRSKKAGDFDDKEEESLDDKIEGRVQSIFRLTDDIGIKETSIPDGQKYKQQFLLIWFLQNIPTIGMFSDEDGNKRFNVLGDYIYPYIYTNLNHRRQIVQRMLKTAVEKNFNRFSTYAWQGKQFLSIQEVPFSCFFTKRGYLNKSSIFKVIIPIEGEVLCKIHQAIEQVEDLEIVKDMKLLAKLLDIKKFFKELMQKEAVTERERDIREKIKSMSEDKMYRALGVETKGFFQDILYAVAFEINSLDDYFIELRSLGKEWNECCLDIIDVYVSGKMDINRLLNSKRKEILKFISHGFFLMQKENYNEIMPHLQTKKLKEEYIQRCEKDVALKAKNQRIIKFILSNGRYSIKKRQLEQCFKAYIIELFEIAEEIEYTKVCEILKNLH